jgi:hypothetical protein
LPWFGRREWWEALVGMRATSDIVLVFPKLGIPKRLELKKPLRTSMALKPLISLVFRHKKRRPWTSLVDQMVGRGNLKQVGIYLFFLVNNLLVNLLGIPVGTLRGLDSDGRCFLSSTPLMSRHRIYQANGRVNISYGW